MKRTFVIVAALLAFSATESQAQGVSLFKNSQLQFAVRIHFPLERIDGHRIDPNGTMSYGTTQTDSLVADGFSVSQPAPGLAVIDSEQSIRLNYRINATVYRLTIQLDSVHSVCDLSYSDSSGDASSTFSFRYFNAAFHALPYSDVNGIFHVAAYSKRYVDRTYRSRSIRCVSLSRDV